jgi:regulation of enolase protein 1 (concanavalin A-like superfamily)
MEAEKPKDLAWIRTVGVSDFWKTHYTFERESASKPKRLSQSFFELLMINTLSHCDLPANKNNWGRQMN